MRLLLRSINLVTALLLICSLDAQLVWAQEEQQASKEYTDDDAFKDAVLNVTNTYRKQHNATGLNWNESLANGAGEWSKRCIFEHSVCPSPLCRLSVVS
jgi:uncharacterized protein YkwD